MKYKEYRELSKEQILELKGKYLSEKCYKAGRDVSMSELADADSLVSDKELWDEFQTTLFTDDDFSCSSGGADV